MSKPPAYRDWYDRLLRDSYVVELRHFHAGRIESGLFDRLDPLLDALRERSRVGQVYTSLNRPGARAAPNAFGTAALKDDDIVDITRLPFDFDAVRPKGAPSTDAELRLAVDARDRFVAMMTAYGWPLPALGMSGNGAHAVYRTRLHSNADWRLAADAIWKHAQDLIRLEGVEFDVKVRNPGRIWRAYGTVNRKGPATPERPHRRAEIVIPASGWEVVSVHEVERVANLWLRAREERSRLSTPSGNVVPLRPPGAGDYSTLDVAHWFASKQHYRRDLGAGKHAVVCPWEHEHTTPDGPLSTAAVIWESTGTGWPTFHCSHAHCEGRRLGDVMLLWGDADQFCGAKWEARRHG